MGQDALWKTQLGTHSSSKTATGSLIEDLLPRNDVQLPCCLLWTCDVLPSLEVHPGQAVLVLLDFCSKSTRQGTGKTSHKYAICGDFCERGGIARSNYLLDQYTCINSNCSSCSYSSSNKRSCSVYLTLALVSSMGSGTGRDLCIFCNTVTSRFCI